MPILRLTTLVIPGLLVLAVIVGIMLLAERLHGPDHESPEFSQEVNMATLTQAVATLDQHSRQLLKEHGIEEAHPLPLVVTAVGEHSLFLLANLVFEKSLRLSHRYFSLRQVAKVADPLIQTQRSVLRATDEVDKKLGVFGPVGVANAVPQALSGDEVAERLLVIGRRLDLLALRPVTALDALKCMRHAMVSAGASRSVEGLGALAVEYRATPLARALSLQYEAYHALRYATSDRAGEVMPQLSLNAPLGAHVVRSGDLHDIAQMMDTYATWAFGQQSGGWLPARAKNPAVVVPSHVAQASARFREHLKRQPSGGRDG